jgi:hypothetical protein
MPITEPAGPSGASKAPPNPMPAMVDTTFMADFTDCFPVLVNLSFIFLVY